MSSELALKVDAVDAQYGSRDVLREITFDVKERETFGLVGLNGVGKTTLIKIILGLKTQTGGCSYVFGHRSGNENASLDIAYLPERFDPPWFLNAYEFVNFSLGLYGRKVPKSKIDEMAERLSLKTSYLNKKAQIYSKGMRQKLGLLTTILSGCRILILDEPMSGLDPLARSQVKTLIMEAKGRGQTVFMCSHILSDMEELCDRVAILDSGAVQYVGEPRDLMAKTAQPTLEKAFLSLIDASVAKVS